MSDVAVAVLDAAIELDDGGAGARVHAEAPDHDQLAADLHDTVGLTLVAIALLARREAEQLSPDSELAERVERLAALLQECPYLIADADPSRRTEWYRRAAAWLLSPRIS